MGILRKPIPEKLVVLTFDDAPASHATVVAPILKSFGFGGSFYVCDFDSFRTRKDWYLTYRQMKAMAEDGFEIGNHTLGHGGGLNNYLAMEDQLLANNVPKPTTVCWPVYAVNRGICADLVWKGHTFGRGGHQALDIGPSDLRLADFRIELDGSYQGRHLARPEFLGVERICWRAGLCQRVSATRAGCSMPVPARQRGRGS